MALLVVNKPFDAAVTTLVKEDLNSGTHTFTYNPHQQVLYVDNGEAAPLTINVLGDGVTTTKCEGYGDIDVSLGLDVVVAAGDTETLYTRAREAYMGASGNVVTVTVTGSTGAGLAFAWLVEHQA